MQRLGSADALTSRTDRLQNADPAVGSKLSPSSGRHTDNPVQRPMTLSCTCPPFRAIRRFGERSPLAFRVTQRDASSSLAGRAMPRSRNHLPALPLPLASPPAPPPPRRPSPP